MTEFVTNQVVIFVDDDASLREANVQSLELAGIVVEAFADAEAALARLDRNFAGAVVSDIRMPRVDGLQLFARIRDIDPTIPVILVTGHADVPTAIAAFQDGAHDFLTKPFASEHLVAAVERALEKRRLVIDNRRLRAAAADQDGSPLIGSSPAMNRLRDVVAQVARADIDVLVEGETGTGKELVALMLHRQGPRRGRPFVAVNCGAIPEALAESELFGHESGAVAHGRLERIGRIEASSGGTLFLDEIDSMSLPVQAKLLRVLEEREVLRLGGDASRAVNLRVVAAAKRDLRQAVDDGDFREDLFYRLDVVRVRVPPLRERRGDVAELFAHFIEQACVQMKRADFVLTDAMRRRLVEHAWPGNVRELRNFAFSSVIGLDDEAPAPAGSSQSLAARVDAFEAAIIRDVLATANGDIRTAVNMLLIPRKTLYDKMTRHGIEPAQFRTRRA